MLGFDVRPSNVNRTEIKSAKIRQTKISPNVNHDIPFTIALFSCAGAKTFKPALIKKVYELACCL